MHIRLKKQRHMRPSVKESTRKKLKKSLKGINKSNKNGMYGKQPYDIWLEKYGKEEADKRQYKMIHRRKETRLMNEKMLDWV